MITAGVRLNHTRINRKAFALDQASVHTSPYHCLEHMAQDVAVAEPPMAVDRERQVIRNLVIKLEPAEPPICEVHLDLLAQSPLETDSIAVAHDQHPDHQLRINRRSTDLAVEGSELLAQVSQHLRHHRIDPAQQMARRNAFFEVE